MARIPHVPAAVRQAREILNARVRVLRSVLVVAGSLMVGSVMAMMLGFMSIIALDAGMHGVAIGLAAGSTVSAVVVATSPVVAAVLATGGPSHQDLGDATAVEQAWQQKRPAWADALVGPDIDLLLEEIEDEASARRTARTEVHQHVRRVA